MAPHPPLRWAVGGPGSPPYVWPWVVVPIDRRPMLRPSAAVMAIWVENWSRSLEGFAPACAPMSLRTPLGSGASPNGRWEVAEADGSRLVHSLSSAPSLCSVHEVFSEAE